MIWKSVPAIYPALPPDGEGQAIDPRMSRKYQSTHPLVNLDPQDARAFLKAMFPGGLRDAAMIAEWCPEGWEKSPLFASFHPSPETRYQESLRMTRNLKRLEELGKKRAGEMEPDEPEPSFEEFLASHPLEEVLISAEDAIEQPAELLGLCLWDVFSDNHEVIAADGRVVDLGSFRGTAGEIADFMEESNGGDGGRMRGGAGYMDFYMGSIWISGRTDLGPVYRWIFRRLQSMGADWRYAFPRIHLVDFGPREPDQDAPYDPSAAFAQDAADKARAEELAKIRNRMDRDVLAAKREARTKEPPATVRAYQEVCGRFPDGWPPDPYGPA